MDSKTRKQFEKTSREDLLKVKADAEKAFAADNGRVDAQEVIGVISEILAIRDGNELEALRAENAALKASATVGGLDEGLIRKKMAAGLSREQAIASIGHQKAFDERKKIVDDERAKQAKKKAQAEKQ